MALPKIEGLIRLTAASVVSVVETHSSGPSPITKSVTVAPAGDYYLTAATGLLATIAAALTGDTDLLGTYTLSLDSTTDTSSGRVTTAAAHATLTGVTITPVSGTALWALLGYASGGAGALNIGLSLTGDYPSRYLWLPTCGRTEGLAGHASAGARVAERATTVSPTGAARTISWGSRAADSLGFAGLRGDNVWPYLALPGAPTTARGTLWQFWDDVISRGLPFVYWPDRGGTQGPTWIALDGATFAAAPSLPGWTESPASLWAWRAQVAERVA
jgi:hypothetical protein